jgi:protein involved in polysaccharide export with SLBB domain
MKKNLLRFHRLIILILFLTFAGTLSSQDISKVKVDQLSDKQVKSIFDKAQASGMTQEQLEAAALAKGMPAEEIQKLRKRIENLDSDKEKISSQNIDAKNRTRTYLSDEYTKELSKETDLFAIMEEKNVEEDSLKTPDFFGAYLFNSKVLTFEPSLNIPTPENYQIGPRDEIAIDIWGASQQSYKLVVAPEGFILVENVGPIYINGLPIDKASKKIIGKLSSIYSGLLGQSPNTFAQVNIGSLRSIKVNIVGEVNTPGSYTLPSLASVFNALYVAGGPTKNGTFREIEVKRENKTVATIDLYDFLVKGEQASNIRLQDQDVILVKPYKMKIELKGEVKVPTIFELKENETMADLIEYAGGFTDKAYQYRLKIIRKTDKEFSVADVIKDQFSQFVMKDGDQVDVEPVINRFVNRVEITGAVYRPGQYELTKGLTLKRLIEQAEGLRDDVFLDRAILYRMGPDMTVESKPIDLRTIIADSSLHIELQKEDVIRVFSIFDLEEKFDLRIQGEVQMPGKYPYIKNMRLSDIIATAGGFKESASLARIEVARRIKNSDIDNPTAQIADIRLFDVSKVLTLSDSASNFILEPFDQIFVRRSPGYELQTYSSVKGEVLFPGTYAIQTKNERISDLVKRAGGLTKESYIKGARLIRQLIEDPKLRGKILKSVESAASEDSAKLQVSLEKEQYIGIDLEKILDNPGSKYDLLLQDGDVLDIPKQLQTVRLSGALLYPITVRYENGINLKSYTKMAGGMSPDALPKNAFVVYANGSVKTTSSFLGLKFYPRIEPGSEIIIPKKAKEEKMSKQEMLALSTAMTSLALIIVTLVSKL